MIDFSRFQFSPVIDLPARYEVFDFTRGYDPTRELKAEFGIGRYDEDRRGMYETELFKTGETPRTIHVGIDIGAPVGTPVKAFYDGEIYLAGYNGSEGDYGHTVITRHVLGGTELFALYGHLSARSARERAPGTPFRAGDAIAWMATVTKMAAGIRISIFSSASRSPPFVTCRAWLHPRNASARSGFILIPAWCWVTFISGKRSALLWSSPARLSRAFFR